MAKQTQTQTPQQELAAAILASIKSPKKDDGSSLLVDIATDSASKVIDGTSRIAGAFTTAFANAGSFYKLEAGVQQVRAEVRLRKEAEKAAARILALG